MTLVEAVKFMPGNQRLSIKVMGIELFSGSKGSLMHTSESEDWINDTVINMQSNSSDTIVIALKDSVYTRDYICGRFIEASVILSEYRKLYSYNKGNGPLINIVKQLLAEIRQDGDIL